MGWWMLAVSLSTSAQSNHLKFQKVQLEINGVPYNTVAAITQDKEGYLWISTNEEGVIRYDGYESKMYLHNPKDSTAIGHNKVQDLYVDETGILWAATIVGLSRYNSSCDCFFQYRFQANNGYDKDNNNEKGRSKSKLNGKGGIRDITEDGEHNLWVAMQAGGLFRYDRAQDKFIPYLNDSIAPNSLIHDYVSVILADRQGNIWIGTGNPNAEAINKGGLIRFNPSTGSSKRFIYEPNNPNSLSVNVITALLEDEAGQIWVGTTENGLHLYNADSEDFTRIKVDTANPTYFQPPFPKKRIQGRAPIKILHQDQQGGYWIGSVGIGLNHFDPKTRKLTFYDLSGGASGLNLPSAFYEDRQGQLWLGYITQSGLFKLDPYARKFNIYSGLKTMQRSCESQLTPGSFWISTRADGLYFLDGNTGKKTSFRHDENDPTSIGNNAVRAVYEDKEGTVWVGLGVGGLAGEEGGKGGLSKMDRETRSFQNYEMKLNDTTDFNMTVFLIEEDQEGFLWLDAGPGLLRFDKEKEVSKRYHLPNSDADARITMVHHNKQFFGALDFGKRIFYKYNIEKDSFITFLEGYQVNYVVENNQGGFWLGTWKQGLVYFNPMEDILKQYTEENGLLDDRIRGLLPGENGNYWLSTYKGLVKFDSKNEKFISEGFPKDHFDMNGMKSRDGQLFFGGSEVVYAFYPDQVNGNPFPPDVLINSLQISGEPFNLDQAATGKINLSHQQNDFNFQYTAIHNGNPAKNKYQYRLLPFDENWIDAGEQRRVQYTNLHPGDYTFQVKAANSDGVWNETPATLSFYIATPWWTRWWAYLLFFISISSILYWFYHFQLSKRLALEESKRLKELNLVKSKLYTNITHEFRTPLTIINGMVDELELNLQKETSKRLQLIKQNSHRLLQMVNQMLQLSKLQAGKETLYLKQEDSILFIRYLVEAYQSLAQSKNISLQFYSEKNQLLMDFDAKKLETVLSNLLSNSIKFTRAYGKILVVAKKITNNNKPILEIQVKDNGIGIAAEQLPHIFDRFHQVNTTYENQGTGIGLALTKELVNNMGGNIAVTSVLDKETVFYLKFPIKNEAPIIQRTANPTILPPSNILEAKDLDTKQIISENKQPILLIIEDNLEVIYYLQACLEEHYQIQIGRNGKEGINKALEIIPDIIISDVMMPEMDGFEVCATLKENERTNHIPIILLTAKAHSKDKLVVEPRTKYLLKTF